MAKNIPNGQKSGHICPAQQPFIWIARVREGWATKKTKWPKIYQMAKNIPNGRKYTNNIHYKAIHNTYTQFWFANTYVYHLATLQQSVLMFLHANICSSVALFSTVFIQI
jgi:hypothetical protein